MTQHVDPRHVGALIGTAGKTIAGLPGAKNLLNRIREADTPERLNHILQSLDIGLDEPARTTIQHAINDQEKWREHHANLLRSAEQQLIERFSSGA